MLVLSVFGTVPAARAEPTPAETKWERADGPAKVRPGDTFEVRLRVRNENRDMWEAGGDHRVMLTAMIVDGNGSPWPSPQRRAPLAYPIPPGAATTVVITILAPSIPGRYRVLIGRGAMEQGKVRLDRATFSWPFVVAAP